MALISRYLDTVGDGTGTKNAAGDYTIATGTPTTFFIAPASGVRYLITRLAIVVQDTTGFLATTYGAAGALATGYRVEHHTDDGTLVTDYMDGVRVRTNAGLLHTADVSFPTATAWDGGAQVLRAVFDFSRWHGDNGGLVLNGTSNERLAIPFTNDNTSGLTGHYFVAQGRTI